MTSWEDGKPKSVPFFSVYFVKSQVCLNSRDLVEQFDLCEIIL